MIYLRRKDFDDFGNLKSDFFKNKIVVIFIHAEFCGYCKIAKPEYLKAEKNNTRKNVIFCAIQADGSFEERNCKDIFSKIVKDFSGFPDYSFFVNGRPVKIDLDSRSEKSILKAINQI